MNGYRQRVRSSVASTLAGVASALSTAAGLAETVAQELRLTLPSEPSHTERVSERSTPVAVRRSTAEEADGSGTVSTAAKEVAPPRWVDDIAAEVADQTVKDATARLPGLTPTQLRALERHERSHSARVTLLRAIDAELAGRA